MKTPRTLKTAKKQGMRHSRTSWLTKLKPELEPRVVETPKGSLLIPTPNLLAEEISKLPAGTLATPALLRGRLAKRFQAQGTCPLCTGIFFNIIAGAAEEQLAAGTPPLAPYWRVVMDKGVLSEKTPPGPARQAERLKAEGVEAAEVKGKWRVPGFEARLAG